jgi:transcriptional regulator with XRE-family HTH domain
MNNLRERRQALGLSQVRLAILTGLPNGIISDFELGKRLPWPRARKALKALGLAESQLFPNEEGGGDGD